MPNAIAKIFALLILVVAVIYVPVYQSFQKQDDLAQQVAYQAVTDFVDNVRMKGYITPRMIEDFEQELHIGTYLFKATYKHERKVYTPVYANGADPNSWTGEYVTDYDEYYNAQIMPYLFDEPQSKSKNKRQYKLSVGDFFSVQVENMTKTKATMLFDTLTNGNKSDNVTIFIPYGGMVLNEDY